MAFCTNCGKQSEGNERFCTNCGAQLPAAQQGYQQSVQQGVQQGFRQGYQQTDQYGYQARKPQIDKKKLYMIIGGVLAVAAIVVLIVVLTGGGSKEVSTKNVEGTWTVTDVSGGGMSADMSAAMAMGASVDVIFKDGRVSMSVSFLGQSTTQTLGSYEIKNGDLYMDGQKTDCKISGSTMTITQNGMTMKLKKK